MRDREHLHSAARFPAGTDQQQAWKHRNVLFSDASGNVYQIVVGDDGKMADSSVKSKLLGLGMGGTRRDRANRAMDARRDRSERHIDYKPLNPAVMGSVVNSMPIDVGPPGQAACLAATTSGTLRNRPEMVYLGADDGMLHAFYAASGQEAFAFIPADMVPIIAKLYAKAASATARTTTSTVWPDRPR